MKKLLLIGINARYTHSNLALMYLRNALDGLACDVRIQEYSINQPMDEIITGISDQKPDALAVSVYIWNTEKTRGLLNQLAEHLPDAYIMLGGPEVSFSADAWLSAFPNVNCILSGRGESSLRHVVSNGFTAEGAVRIPAPPLAELPFAYRENDFERLKHKYLYYESSRGCPMRCSYCLSSREDEGLEFRPLEKVKQELSTIIRHKPRLIKFVDRTFNASKAHSRAIWSYVIENFSSNETTFHFEIYPQLLEDEDFRILSKAPSGLMQFEIGIQSVHERTLRAVNRTGNWEKIRMRILRLLSGTNIHIHVDLIAGLPFEDMDQIGESFDAILSLKAHHFQFGFLKLLPGTELDDRKKEFGMTASSHPPYPLTENRWISADDMQLLEIIEDMLERLCNSGKFQTTADFLLARTSSPFQLFRKIAESARSAGSLSNREWAMTAAILLRFAESDRTESVSELRDCLRWDWCLIQKSTRYPSVLTDDSVIQKRHTLIRSLSETGTERIDPRVLRKSRIFSSESTWFRKRYLQGCECCIFLPDGHLKFTDLR